MMAFPSHNNKQAILTAVQKMSFLGEVNLCVKANPPFRPEKTQIKKKKPDW